MQAYLQKKSTAEKIFEEMRATAACIFAPRAKIIYGPPIYFSAQGRLSLPDNVLQSFKYFNERVEADQLDAFIIGTSGSCHPQSIDDLKQITKAVLTVLSIEDMGYDNAHKMISSAGSDGWWYVFDGNRYIPTVFSSIYPALSPRNTLGHAGMFIMFQPVQSFNNKSIPKGHEISEAIRETIRQKYREKGCPYNETLIKSYYEGLKVIEGIPQSEIIEWWK